MSEQLGEPQISPVPFCWAGSSDKGKVRQENEDAFIVDGGLGLFVVSDGMGGHHGGAVASKIVIEVLPKMIDEKFKKLRSHSTQAVRGMLKKTIFELNRHVRTEGLNDSGFEDMAATVVMAMVVQGRVYVANVGDSRLYLFRNNKLLQLTEDHSVVSELLRQGRIEPADTRNHPAQGEITRYIGIDNRARPCVRTFAAKTSDRLLLCTDGLTDMIANEAIVAILRDNPDAQRACEALVDAANAAGGHDNITVVIADWPGY